MSGVPGDGLTPDELAAHINRLLADPAGRLSVTTDEILADVDPKLLAGLAKHAAGEPPSTTEYLRDIINTPTGRAGAGAAAAAGGLPALAGLAAVFVGKRIKHARKHRHIANAAPGFTVSRAAIGFKDSERAVLRGMAMLWALGRIDWAQWRRFYAQLAWAGGKAEIIPPALYASSRHIDDARKYINNLCTHIFPDHEEFLRLAAAKLGTVANETGELGRLVGSLLNAGARWMRPDDIATSKIYTTNRTRSSLLIGAMRDGGQPVYFDGNESLATVAGAGTGKTAAQVIPNLLAYPGSCFVLDVKDELWAKTAAHRQRAFGPVYRFAPTDPNGYTHNYNPFDIIPRRSANAVDIATAERECQVMASMIIPDRADNRDPFWENKAREYLWAFAMAVAFNAAPDVRALASVSRLFAMRTGFADQAEFEKSDTCQILEGLNRLAKTIAIPALAHASSAILGMIREPKTLLGIFDTARSHLNPLTRSPTCLAAMQTSDWHPLDLRRRPGTTVYLCLKPDEMKAYAPLVRLVFQQHVSQLTRNFTPKPGELPITFFLDEMPQLGYMPNMPDIIDVGRGAAVRLWMFMQYMGQIRDIYKAKGAALIDACRVRSYISPDPEAYKAIQPLLGETHNIFSGEKKPLVHAHELAGRDYADDVVAVATGEHPGRFAKTYYFKDTALLRLTELPAPTVKAKRPAAQPHPPGGRATHATPAIPATTRGGGVQAVQGTNAAVPARRPVQPQRDPVRRPRRA